MDSGWKSGDGNLPLPVFYLGVILGPEHLGLLLHFAVHKFTVTQLCCRR